MASQKHNHTSWVEIDLKAVRHNFQALKKMTHRQIVELRSCDGLPARGIRVPKILGVVKAESYGHGMLPVTKELIKLGVDFLGVSELAEGIALRQKKIKKPILVFETPLPSMVKDYVDHGLISTVCSDKVAKALNAYARKTGQKAEVHIKVDTGMGRLGVWYPEAVDFIRRVMQFPSLRVTGLYTHFPLADTDAKFTQRQIDAMAKLVRTLDDEGHDFKKILQIVTDIFAAYCLEFGKVYKIMFRKS